MDPIRKSLKSRIAKRKKRVEALDKKLKLEKAELAQDERSFRALTPAPDLDAALQIARVALAKRPHTLRELSECLKRELGSDGRWTGFHKKLQSAMKEGGFIEIDNGRFVLPGTTQQKQEVLNDDKRSEPGTDRGGSGLFGEYREN